jgi:serine-type D-Ala-D-Ala carboxypeptidase
MVCRSCHGVFTRQNPSVINAIAFDLRIPFLPTTTTSLRFPALHFDDQERVFATAFTLLQNAVESRAFPCACVAVTHAEKVVARKAFGRFTYEQDSAPADIENIFDLASVSKVVATTVMAMILYERGLLALEMPIVSVLPEFSGSDLRRAEVTGRMLLAHSSGLPAYEKLYLRASTRDELLRECFSTPLRNAPGSHAEYSDMGFILLGVALERIAGEPLDAFCQREVFGPLGMSQTTFNPPASWRPRIPPTGDDRTFRNRIIRGEVQDENASVMGGVAGHAGVFSTASDLAVLAQALLRGGAPIIQPQTLGVFTHREHSPPGTSRALGWDTPSAPSQSGKYFAVSSYGHLGYTGTSLWIDPERQLAVALLTNRTWPDCSNQAIKEIRPRFHDAIIEALEAKR